MSEFWEDQNLRSCFFQGQVEPRATETEIRYIEWSNETVPPGKERPFLREQDLEGDPLLRVIFAPLDLPGNNTLRPLFNRYKIPAAFVSERQHSVTYGSGSRTCANGFYSSWFHYLCKSIDVAHDLTSGPNSLQIVDPRRANTRRPIDQSNWTWLRGGFFLHWAPRDTQQTTPQQNILQQIQLEPSVTLICFGGPQSLIERFRELTGHPGWRKTVQDPYSLFIIVFQEIFKQMDQQAWNLGDVFRDIEAATLQKAAEINTGSTRYDFVGLYNIAKHCTYLREGFDATLETMADISAQHQRAALTANPLDRDGVQSMIKHEQRLFKSASFRVVSLNSRIQSIISLSFNLVTQQDSQVIWQDNQTMKAIAFITLLFLPMATVATFFGCQFFGLDTSTSPPTFRVSPQIWIFWTVLAGVMIVMLPMWRMAQVGIGRSTKAPLHVSTAPSKKLNGNRLPWGFRTTRSTGNIDATVELTSTA